MALVVSPVTMPASLSGAANGNLDTVTLADVRVARWGILHLHKHMARVWAAFEHDCRKATGVTLTVTSPADAYRSLPQQKSTFFSRYEECSYIAYLAAAMFKRGKVWPAGVSGAKSTSYWRKRQYANGSYPATAAVPGLSNHGWGLAVDVAEFAGPSSPPTYVASSKAWPWIVANAARYGLSWEAQSEPWHLRYYAGDRIPAAVLAYETPPPTPGGPMSGEAKFVKITDQGSQFDPAVFIATGKTMSWVTTGAEKQVHAFIGTATNDPSTGQPWLLDRGILKNFVLVGPAPVYGPGVPIQTVPGHFQAWVQ